MQSKFYISPKVITFCNGILLIISLLSILFLNINVALESLNLYTLIALSILIFLIAIIFNSLTLKIKHFSITDHWIEKISLSLLLISSIGQEIFFRGVLSGIVGVLLSTMIFTLWNFFPNKKRTPVLLFFFVLGLIQSAIYLYTNNIIYVIYTNFMFHILIRMLKYKKL